jgi:hypothetical protein
VSLQAVTAARRRLLARGATLGLAAGAGLGLLSLGGCSNLPGGLKNFEISADQLRQAMAGQFPQQKRLLEVFDVTLSLPTLKLNAEANRIDTAFDVALLETLVTRRSFRGSVGFGSGVRYEPIDHSVRLQHVNLDKLDLPGVPGVIGAQVQRVAKVLAESLLEGLSVYHMPKGIAQLVDTLGTQPEELKVTPTGVAVSFKPMRV